MTWASVSVGLWCGAWTLAVFLLGHWLGSRHL